MLLISWWPKVKQVCSVLVSPLLDFRYQSCLFSRAKTFSTGDDSANTSVYDGGLDSMSVLGGVLVASSYDGGGMT